MTWLWISAIVILLGAKLNSEIKHQTARDSNVGSGKALGTRGASWLTQLAPYPGISLYEKRARCDRASRASGRNALVGFLCLELGRCGDEHSRVYRRDPGHHFLVRNWLRSHGVDGLQQPSLLR